MSIKKEKNGTYTLSYTKKDAITQKKTRTKKRGFVTLKEAKEYERSLSRESSTVTFKSLFEECLQNKDILEATKDEEKKLYKNHLSVLDNVKYEQLTKPFLLQLRNEISKKEISNKTKNKIIGIIKNTCKFANKIYDLDDNTIVLEHFKTKNIEMQTWSPEEYAKFEDALKGKYDNYIPFFHALFWTGMRKGEARALQVNDLDVENSTLTISKSMRKYKSSLKEPKTVSGNRKIKLDIKTLEILKPLQCHEKWLFGDYKPMNLTMINKAFKYGIENSGVKPIRIHDLRHSHASYLLGKGANLVAVSKRLGHASINMTLSTYTHLIKDSEEQLIDLLNEASKN